MKRTGFKPRKPAIRKVKTADPGLFYLETVDGHRWLWPTQCLTETQWDGTLMDWAFKASVLHWKKAWHCTVANRSEAGFFDRVWLRPGQGLMTELKVRYSDGRANGTSSAQDEYIYAGIEAGYDVRVWTFPDDACEAWTTLTGRPLSESPYMEMRR